MIEIRGIRYPNGPESEPSRRVILLPLNQRAELADIVNLVVCLPHFYSMWMAGMRHPRHLELNDRFFTFRANIPDMTKQPWASVAARVRMFPDLFTITAESIASAVIASWPDYFSPQAIPMGSEEPPMVRRLCVVEVNERDPLNAEITVRESALPNLGNSKAWINALDNAAHNIRSLTHGKIDLKIESGVARYRFVDALLQLYAARLEIDLV